jgi:hypothetical protein
MACTSVALNAQWTVKCISRHLLNTPTLARVDTPTYPADEEYFWNTLITVCFHETRARILPKSIEITLAHLKYVRPPHHPVS